MNRMTSAIAAFALIAWLGTAAHAADKVHVFFLVGQSNMEGKGDPQHLDTYRDDPLIRGEYAKLKDGDGWAVRDDVFITYPSKHGGPQHGPLTVGFGTKGDNSIGPEFGFGHTAGNALDEPIVLIKIAWGGKSLLRDFRPPSAPPTDAELNSTLEKAKKKNPNATLDQVKASYGAYYRKTIAHAKEELAQLDKRFPSLIGREVEVAGFVWHQGFNDIINRELRDKQYAEYTRLLIHFIRDVRRDLGAPGMPFVIGELSTGGLPNRGAFQAAQANAAKAPGFEGNVAFVPTAEYYDTVAHGYYERGYWKKGSTPEQKKLWQSVGNDRPYHYLGSGKTYYLKGVAFCRAVLDMMPESP